MPECNQFLKPKARLEEISKINENENQVEMQTESDEVTKSSELKLIEVDANQVIETNNDMFKMPNIPIQQQEVTNMVVTKQSENDLVLTENNNINNPHDLKIKIEYEKENDVLFLDPLNKDNFSTLNICV